MPDLRSTVSFALAALLLACKPAPALAPAAQAPGAARSEPQAAATTVIVVRHGEKAADDPRDPSLSPAGEARARALAGLLAQAGVTHLFATEFRRTQATLGPLASATGREIAVVPAADAGALLAAIRALPAGSVAVVAGHSNTVPGLVDALGGAARGAVSGPAGPQLPDDAFDRLFVLLVPSAPGAPASTLELRYGSTTPPTAPPTAP